MDRHLAMWMCLAVFRLAEVTNAAEHIESRFHPTKQAFIAAVGPFLAPRGPNPPIPKRFASMPPLRAG